MDNTNDPSLAGIFISQVDSPEEKEASNVASCRRRRPGWKSPMNQPSRSFLITLSILVPVVITLICVIFHLVFKAEQKSEQCSPGGYLFVPDGPACPSGWVCYERKCYFFSNEERNWTSCQSFCTSNNSSLAIIKMELEKVFMLRYKGNAGHWIGLKKNLHTWKWVDGMKLNNMLEVKGEGGDCAFLSSGYAISSQCHVPRRWICSHPDMYTRNISCPIGT